MTTAYFRNDPTVKVVAHGRDSNHDPELCSIENVIFKKFKRELWLIASAGGYYRGVKLRWHLPSKFLLTSYAELQGIEGSELEIVEQLITHLVERRRALVGEKLGELPLELTSLKKRTVALLAKDGISNLGRLAKSTKSKLMRISGVGQKSVNEIAYLLADYGLYEKQFFER